MVDRSEQLLTTCERYQTNFTEEGLLEYLTDHVRAKNSLI